MRNPNVVLATLRIILFVLLTSVITSVTAYNSYADMVVNYTLAIEDNSEFYIVAHITYGSNILARMSGNPVTTSSATFRLKPGRYNVEIDPDDEKCPA